MLFNKIGFVVAIIGLGSLASAQAPLKTLAVGTNAVPNEYIVKLRADVKDAAGHLAKVKQIVQEHNAKPAAAGSQSVQSGVKSVWKAALNGYAAKLSDEALAALRNLPEVEYVEHNKRVGVAEGQWNAPWNLVRISSRKKYSGPDYYTYGGWAGYETKVFVVDTGIRTTHGEFEGKASWGANFIDTNNYDGHGHGTHCAALVCSRDYGVAKMAQLVAVKVLGNDGWGTDESVISGIDWVTQQHKAGNGGRRGTIISMSVGGGKSDAINAAANNAVAAGIYVVVAAGNSADDACNYSPSSAENVITVGATDINDKLASFSNYGKCVDILSPGVNVLSAFNRNDWDNIYMSGTSMSTPQVSGVVATFAAMQGSMLSPAALFDVVKTKANLNAISGIPDSATPNVLVNNGSS